MAIVELSALHASAIISSAFEMIGLSHGGLNHTHRPLIASTMGLFCTEKCAVSFPRSRRRCAFLPLALQNRSISGRASPHALSKYLGTSFQSHVDSRAFFRLRSSEIVFSSPLMCHLDVAFTAECIKSFRIDRSAASLVVPLLIE